MRGTSGTLLLTALGLLAALGLTAPGCQSPGPIGGVTPPTASVGPMATLGSPVPLGADAPELEGPVQEVVWRGSAHGLPPDRSASSAIQPATLQAPARRTAAVLENDLPRELNKVTLPPYVIEPPDILLINVSRVIPKPPYRIEPLDELVIQAPPRELLPSEPISGTYPVSPEGRVDLAFSYGQVAVAGKTIEEAAEAIKAHLVRHVKIKAPQVTVALGRTHAAQQVRGEYLVRMDGTVSLGVYGEVYLAGMTLPQARMTIEAHLSRFLLSPQATVDVRGYNSKVYYVVFDGGRSGQKLVRMPLVGGETVLDALSQLGELPCGAAVKIWIARPVPGYVGKRQLLPVDWAAILEGGATNTNYQLFPGDRIFVKSDPWGALHHRIRGLTTPLERLCGVVLHDDAVALPTPCGP